MSRFTTLLWDVDGTLLDFVYSQRYAIAKCFRSIGREITEDMLERYRQINDSYWKRLELGEVTKQQLLTGRFLDLFEEYGITGVDVEPFRKEYQEGLGSVYKYIDDSLDICRSLQGKVKQYVITNGVTSTQESKLKLSGLYDVMDGIFISEQVGMPKPQKGFFNYCLEVIAQESGERDNARILIVGDSLTSDIKGGVLNQIPTCWYRPENIFETEPGTKENYERYTPDYEISDLHEVYEILGEGEWQNQKDRS